MIDFVGIKAAALSCSHQLLQEWLPTGTQKGNEWVAINPRRPDHTLGSFSINMTTGVWMDFATDDRGGDLISLKAYLEDIGQGEAANLIAERLSLPTDTAHHTRSTNQAAPPPVITKTPGRDPYKDIPSDSPPPDFTYNNSILISSQPSDTWTYHDSHGKPVGYVARYKRKDGEKEPRPYTWSDNKWRMGAMPAPRPLYNLHLLTQNPDAGVVLVEGEKAADAAQTFFSDAIVTTWAGGCSAWRKTDFNTLIGRSVILWPDNDDCGIQTMQNIQDHLTSSVGAANCLLLTPSPILPKTWDAADALADGWTSGDVLEMFRGFPKTPNTRCPRL